MDQADQGFEGMVGRIRSGAPSSEDGRRGGGLLLAQDLGCLSHGNVLPAGLGSVRPEKLLPLPCGASLAVDSKGRIVGLGTPPGGTRLSQSRSDLLIIGYAVKALGRVLTELEDRKIGAEYAPLGAVWTDLADALHGVEGVLVREVGPLPPIPGEESTGDADKVCPEVCLEGDAPLEDPRDRAAMGPDAPG